MKEEMVIPHRNSKRRLDLISGECMRSEGYIAILWDEIKGRLEKSRSELCQAAENGLQKSLMRVEQVN